MKLVLVGYMGSGKSTIGKILAQELNAQFYDLDTKIEETVGMSISEIFKKKGELFFRKTETKVLDKLLDYNSSFILAVGGGTPCYGTNMKIIKEKATASFYLKLNIPSLLNRITKEKQHRPLIASIKDEDLPEFIGKHLFERSSFYSQATHTITCDDLFIEDVVKEIKSHYSK